MWISDINCAMTKLDDFGEERFISIKKDTGSAVYVIIAYQPSSNLLVNIQSYALSPAFYNNIYMYTCYMLAIGR